MLRKLLFVSLIGLSSFTSANAADLQDTPVVPTAMTELLACGDVGDPVARLTCYDAKSQALKGAQARGEIAVVDRQEVTTVRNRLFGLGGSAFPNLFGGGGDAEELEQIETTLVKANQSGDGSWSFTLENGTVWRQIDSQNAYIRGRPGQTVRIRRAALGSYLMNVGTSRALRVRRQ